MGIGNKSYGNITYNSNVSKKNLNPLKRWSTKFSSGYF